MDETKQMKSRVKPIGEKMITLVEKIQGKFQKKYGFEPSITDVTNMIADAVEKKGIYIV